VFNPLARTGTGTNPTFVNGNTNPDLLMSFPRTASPASYGMSYWDKLRGFNYMLRSTVTSAQTFTNNNVLQGWTNTGYRAGADFVEGYINYSGSTYVNYLFTRAPKFFDVVCWNGNGNYTQQYSHNLNAKPELLIVKCRSSGTDGDTSWNAGWNVAIKGSGTLGYWFIASANSGLNSANASDYSDTFEAYFDSTTTFIPWGVTVSSGNEGPAGNCSGKQYVGYLFASCPGVSKISSYTGTGTTLQIDCGFSSGARFVMIKRASGTGDWYVWDSARGITSGNDPYLLMNSGGAEVTFTNYINATSSGFQINATAPTDINGSGGTFVYLAIA
jgi:hypothetical protein